MVRIITFRLSYCSLKSLFTKNNVSDVIGVINKINDMTEIQRRDGVVVKKRMFNINDHELKNVNCFLETIFLFIIKKKIQIL